MMHPARKTDFLCPMCKVQLVTIERYGIDMELCPNCRGIWLDSGELDRIVNQSDHGTVSVAQDRLWNRGG